MNVQETIQLSKLLSYVLRHGAIKEKLTISPDGYIAIQDLLSRPKFKNITIDQIQHVVETNDKKRFELKQMGEQYYIRASQGHSLKSIESEGLLQPLDHVTTPIIHGTTLQAWESIKTQGLSVMNRNHIHFAVGLPDDPNVKSGMRKTSQVFIYIDFEKAKKDGILFYESANHVILSNGINGIIKPIYFQKVVNKQGQEI